MSADPRLLAALHPFHASPVTHLKAVTLQNGLELPQQVQRILCLYYVLEGVVHKGLHAPHTLTLTVQTPKMCEL